uniref:NADH-ubiquinone oxidoreductase chain 2 n=1 Tax=Carapus bermudensis TaxID=181393 RepID=Q8HMJ4_9TELE|nr:NADH dehydrogenase subunit 2 [Carapus bermudensis]BAC23165.1 NADH dehydrogenase subunit 2 [Carapus bermudensis]
MSPYIMTALLMSLGLGTTITFASSHWLFAWIGLEINTLAIIPLMASHHHPRATEAATKYFLVQATASATILFAAISSAWQVGHWVIFDSMDPLSNTLLLAALALKLGLAPLHGWLPEVLQGLNLTTGLILSTWQKLAPFSILLQTHPHSPATLVVLGMLSTLVGGWGGLNQTQLRKILAYSSIAHLGWMVIVMAFAPGLSMLAMIMYIVMTSTIFLVLIASRAFTINSLATAWSAGPLMAALTSLCLLSLGGLPPLSGFMPKLLIIHELTKQELAIPATITALSALLSLYFYLRLAYAYTLTSSPNTPASCAQWRLQPISQAALMPITIVAALLLLPMTPTALALMAQ